MKTYNMYNMYNMYTRTLNLSTNHKYLTFTSQEMFDTKYMRTGVNMGLTGVSANSTCTAPSLPQRNCVTIDSACVDVWELARAQY